MTDAGTRGTIPLATGSMARCMRLGGGLGVFGSGVVATLESAGALLGAGASSVLVRSAHPTTSASGARMARARREARGIEGSKRRRPPGRSPRAIQLTSREAQRQSLCDMPPFFAQAWPVPQSVVEVQVFMQ